jgi:predicted DNA-binding transcriptional regulator YafY
LLVTPAIEAKLNERQQRMVGFLAEGKQLTNRGCQKEFGVGRDTVTRDFNLLKELGIAKSKGRGRSTSYVLVTRD